MIVKHDKPDQREQAGMQNQVIMPAQPWVIWKRRPRNQGVIDRDAYKYPEQNRTRPPHPYSDVKEHYHGRAGRDAVACLAHIAPTTPPGDAFSIVACQAWFKATALQGEYAPGEYAVTLTAGLVAGGGLMVNQAWAGFVARSPENDSRPTASPPCRARRGRPCHRTRVKTPRIVNSTGVKGDCFILFARP